MMLICLMEIKTLINNIINIKLVTNSNRKQQNHFLQLYFSKIPRK